MQAVFIVGAVAIVGQIGVHQVDQRWLLHGIIARIRAQNFKRDEVHGLATHQRIDFTAQVQFIIEDAHPIAFRRQIKHPILKFFFDHEFVVLCFVQRFLKHDHGQHPCAVHYASAPVQDRFGLIKPKERSNVHLFCDSHRHARRHISRIVGHDADPTDRDLLFDHLFAKFAQVRGRQADVGRERFDGRWQLPLRVFREDHAGQGIQRAASRVEEASAFGIGGIFSRRLRR